MANTFLLQSAASEARNKEVKRRIGVLIALLVCAAAVLVFILTGALRIGGVGETHRLPDGSTLQLLQVAFPGTNYTFNYQSGNRWLRKILPLLPPSMRSRFTGGSGSLGWSGLEGTNLIAITAHRSNAKGWSSRLGRLRFFDDQGNTYDAVWGASMLGNPGEAVHGWRAHAFPRRGRMLGLQFFMNDSGRAGTNVAEFRIWNPLYAKYPQWTPEPWPTAKHDGTLAVILKEFKAWAEMAAKDSRVASRTRLVLLFAENGTESTDWRIQKLTISDATGNRWSPYLDFVGQDWNWTTNGTLEFVGALWPGEHAWKLRIEMVRAAGFEPEQLWEVRVPLPPPNIATPLTNTWEHDGITVRLVSVASPETDHTGDFKWIAKWWGEDKKKVYSLALSVDPKPAGKRLSVIRASDENDREIKIVQHGSQDSDKQAVFFKSADGATDARFTFAVQRSRFVEFLARPEFADPHSTREREDSTITRP